MVWSVGTANASRIDVIDVMRIEIEILPFKHKVMQKGKGEPADEGRQRNNVFDFHLPTLHIVVAFIAIARFVRNFKFMVHLPLKFLYRCCI